MHERKLQDTTGFPWFAVCVRYSCTHTVVISIIVTAVLKMSILTALIIKPENGKTKAEPSGAN